MLAGRTAWLNAIPRYPGYRHEFLKLPSLSFSRVFSDDTHVADFVCGAVERQGLRCSVKLRHGVVGHSCFLGKGPATPYLVAVLGDSNSPANPSSFSGSASYHRELPNSACAPPHYVPVPGCLPWRATPLSSRPRQALCEEKGTGAKG